MCLRVSRDSSRLLVGLGAGGALVFGLHSGRPMRVLPPAQPAPLSALLLTENDDFLFAAGTKSSAAISCVVPLDSSPIRIKRFQLTW